MNTMAPTFPTLTDRERKYPAIPAIADGFPEGWSMRRVPRGGGGITAGRPDNIFYSPILGLKFRTRPEVRRFLVCLGETGGDEAAALRRLKGLPGDSATGGKGKATATAKRATGSSPSSLRRDRPPPLRAEAGGRRRGRDPGDGGRDRGATLRREHRNSPMAVKLEEATRDESTTGYVAIKQEDAVDLAAVKQDDTVDLADFTSFEEEKGVLLNGNKQGSNANPVAVPATPTQEEEKTKKKETEKEKENLKMKMKQTKLDDEFRNKNLIRRHIPKLGTGSNGASLSSILSKVQKSAPSLYLRRWRFEEIFGKELEIIDVEGKKRYFLRPHPPCDRRTVTGKSQPSVRPDFQSSEGGKGNLLNNNKSGYKANAAIIPDTPPREEEMKKKGWWSPNDIKDLIRPHIPMLGTGSNGVCFHYIEKKVRASTPGLKICQKPFEKSFGKEIEIQDIDGERRYSLRKESSNRLSTDDEIKDLIRPHIPVLGTGSKGPCFSYIVQKVKESVPQFKLRLGRFKEIFGEELKTEGFGSAKRYYLRPFPPRDGGAVRSELLPLTRPPSEITLDSGIEGTKPKQGRDAEKKYLSKSESHAEVEEFLLTLLPSLQRKDVDEYRKSFAGDGFDSRDMLECVEKEDLHFMKMAHQRELWKRLKKSKGTPRGKTTAPKEINGEDAGVEAPKKSKKKKRKRETKSSKSNQTDSGCDDDAGVKAPKKSKKKKRKRETKSSKSNKTDSGSNDGASFEARKSKKKKRKRETKSSESNRTDGGSEGKVAGVEADRCKKKRKKKHKKRKKE